MAAQHSITSRSTRLVAAVCLALLLEPARPAVAQNTGELVDLPFLVHWAGGEGLDGGSYNVGGETLRFFRLPVSYDPGDEGRSWGLRLRFETASIVEADERDDHVSKLPVSSYVYSTAVPSS